MLVISRKLGERVHIGEDIQIVILEITGSRVVIGIAAPREIAIRRVGAMPNEPAGSALSPASAVGRVDPPQPSVLIEYRYAAAVAQAPPHMPAPWVRIGRFRPAVVRRSSDAVEAVS